MSSMVKHFHWLVEWLFWNWCPVLHRLGCRCIDVQCPYCRCCPVSDGFGGSNLDSLMRLFCNNHWSLLFYLYLISSYNLVWMCHNELKNVKCNNMNCRLDYRHILNYFCWNYIIKDFFIRYINKRYSIFIHMFL